MNLVLLLAVRSVYTDSFSWVEIGTPKQDIEIPRINHPIVCVSFEAALDTRRNETYRFKFDDDTVDEHSEELQPRCTHYSFGVVCFPFLLCKI